MDLPEETMQGWQVIDTVTIEPLGSLSIEALMDSVKSGSRDGATVRKLDEFPELVEALRDGDLPTARSVCAQLFGIPRPPLLNAGEKPGTAARSASDSA